MEGSILRFADVRLGQPVPLVECDGSAGSLGERVCDMVRSWSGAASALLVSLQEECVETAGEPLAASVVGRHLGGSNRADVEVLVRSSEIARTRAVVRVTLA
ncbi:hypothetical protein [Rhizorhabdus sp.]|jgi:hypothetical protein|uniref:hypothetical protein n=1 Tax=Rhizorhabdus sp. TaxID=1968843 RepID=UPI001B3CBFC8|nr:hypothetical protein [Rhizorhabdus sp.]MBP8233207.1 hypothetical protein [Rhizorhabdus sp.]